MPYTVLRGHFVIRYPDLPRQGPEPDGDTVLSNGIDANGRMIGFVYPGEPQVADGASIFLDEAGVDASVNASLLRDGLVYPAFYGTLPATLRMHLSVASRAARAAGLGLWPVSVGDPATPAVVTDLAALETLALWPKLFRRLVPYLATGQSSLDGLDGWLREDPVNRDDALFFLDPPEPGNLHDLIVADGDRVFLNRWPEDFIIEPDPASPGTPTGPGAFVAGDLVLVAALPDPVGTDAGAESATVLNTTSAAIDLTGWQLGDWAGHRQTLGGTVAGGETLRLRLAAGTQLPNKGGSLTLFDAGGQTIDHVTYTRAARGRTVVFGR